MIKLDCPIQISRSKRIVINKKKQMCQLVDFGSARDNKGMESTHWNLKTSWNMKMVISILKNLEKRLQKLEHEDGDINPEEPGEETAETGNLIAHQPLAVINAKFIFIHINSSISNNSVCISIVFLFTHG